MTYPLEQAVTAETVPQPPGAIPLQDMRQLTGIQAARRDALRLAIDLCRHRSQLTSEAVVQVADEFSEFIRHGTVPALNGKKSK